MYTAYRKFMTEYQTLGHMAPASEAGTYFIPHYAVLISDGDLSKIRVVFNASAISSSGRSLKDVLSTGPKLQTDLRDILIRDCMQKCILTPDIVKMYRQILIRPEDRKFQHIFWSDSPEVELQEFQLSTITYVLNCAPFYTVCILLYVVYTSLTPKTVIVFHCPMTFLLVLLTWTISYSVPIPKTNYYFENKTYFVVALTN